MDTLGGKRAFLLEKNTKLNHHVSSTNTKANHHVSLSPSHPAVPGVTLGQGLLATRAGGWESSTLPAWKCNGSQEKGEVSKVTSIMANTLLPSGLLRKGTKFPQACRLPLARRGCSREGQRKEGACELSKESPEPTRVVEQPALTKALVRGAGTAEEDPSEQKAHQDGTGEEEE